MSKQRESNIELYRIVLMILIISHHYVVNSGLLDIIYSNPSSANSIFWIIFGAWGKVGINCFILITGYYMCKSKITLRKFLKLFLEVLFYNIVISLIFMIFTNKVSLFNGVYSFLPINTLSVNFTGCFLIFYLLIPFINILIKNISKQQHLTLILVLLLFYTLLPTFPKYSLLLNYVEWFIIIYLIGSYIRLYPMKMLEDKKFVTLGCLFSYILSIISIILLLRYSNNHGVRMAYFFVNDSNKILAVIDAVFLFLLFKNMKIKNNKIINWIASSIFGVLLIHANSDAMRSFLWKDVLNLTSLYNNSLVYNIMHGVVSVLVIFIICILIDKVRIVLFEKPFFKLIDDKIDKLEQKIKKFTHIDKI